MTRTYISVRGVAWSAGRLLVGAATALCLIQCSAEQPTGDDAAENVASVQNAVVTPHCGSVACTNVNDCMTVATWPLCAKTGSAQCFGGSECTYQLKVDSACPCLERDVRNCNMNPTTGGVQICVANAARTYTYWDACQATPVCI